MGWGGARRGGGLYTAAGMPRALLTQRVQTSCHERLVQSNLQAQQISHFRGQVLYDIALIHTAQRVARCHSSCQLANVHRRHFRGHRQLLGHKTG